MVSPKRMKSKKPVDLIIVRSLDEIPSFASEDEEREWWATHQLSEELYEQLEDASSELDEILRSVPAKPGRSAR
jgi:hypothetical protein